MKTLLLIGGTGFFGKSFLDCYKRGLLDKWEITKVLIMSRNVEKIRIEVPDLLDSSVQLISGDVGRIKSLPYADFVIHAAASTDARSYTSKPSIEKQNIQAATYNYCELAKLVHRKSKILYVSSGAVYGPQPSDMPLINESYNAVSLEGFTSGKQDYALAKRDAEEAIQNLGRLNLNVAIARCFAFVGPWLPRNQHFAIGNFIAHGLAKEAILVNATSPVVRSYMYADDLVEWLMSLASNASTKCPIWNVGSEQAITIVDLAIMLGKQFGVPVQIGPQKPKPIDRYVPSVAKAHAAGMKYLDLKAAIDQTLIKIRANEK